MGKRDLAGGIVVRSRCRTQPYTIQRRPAPAANSREISLPTNVVIDLTTWGNPATSSRHSGSSRSGRSFRPG